jgi:hypothetical protein
VADVERIRLPELSVRLDGARVPAYTELVYAGAYQLTLSSALPAIGVELHSSYLGHPDAAEALASHLCLAPDSDPFTWSTAHRGAELPVADARRRCLYDHALCLQQQLSEHSGAEVTVELPDEALALVDAA